MLLYLSLLTSAQAAPIRVAVEQGPSSTSTGAGVVDQLNDDTYFDFTATLVTADQIDSADELEAYDVVVFGDSGNRNHDWTEAMATALETWVDAGRGGVVSTGWADYAIVDGIAGGEALDEIMPIDAYPDSVNHFCSPPDQQLVITSTAHPVTDGLSTFDLPGNNVEISPFAPDAVNGAVLATAEGSGCTSTPTNAVVVGELGRGRTVYLGGMYMASTSYGVDDLRIGDSDRLFEQAVFWAAPDLDADDDGVIDDEDNCPSVPNDGQEDADADDIGDACDECTDLDDDGYGDAGYPANTCDEDNCPDVPNDGQEDADADDIGDVCDECTDVDDDGYGDPAYAENTCDDDCDDGDDTVYPGAPELDDGIDNDCDGVDETVDTDGDGLTDEQEQTLGTDPNKADTDDGGVNDGDEVNRDFTDPLDGSDDKVDDDEVDGCGCNTTPGVGALALFPLFGLLLLRRRRS